MVRTLAKFIIGLLSLWAVAFIIAEIIGVTIYFPFTVVEKQEIPDHRITSVRLAVFLPVAYFGFRYLFFQSEKLYPIQFLEIYIKSLTVCCLFVFYTSQVEFREYYFILFLFIVSLILHFASRNKIRNYFN